MNNKNLQKVILVLLTLIAATMIVTPVYAVEDYRAIPLFYNSGFQPITKPTADLQITSAGLSASDGGSISIMAGGKIYFNAGGCIPGTATAIAEYDFQYKNPVTGFVLAGSVPSEMTLTTPGTWSFYLSVRGNIPSYYIYGNYDDWSENGSYSVIGEKNSEPMYWYFVKVDVVVQSSTPSPDFSIRKGGTDVTGGTVNTMSMPVTVDLVDSSSNATSYEWFIKTPAHADYVFFSSQRNPSASIYTPGLTNFKLRINGSYEKIKNVFINEKKLPVAVIVGPASAEVNDNIPISGKNSYSQNTGGVIVYYSWSYAGASGSLSTSTGEGTIAYATPGRYAVSLSVTDNEGLSSLTVTSYIDVAAAIPIQSDLPPIADFVYGKPIISLSENLVVTDLSRTAGSLEIITQWEWKCERFGVPIYSGNAPLLYYMETGEYSMYLRVKSSNGKWSAGTDYKTWVRRDFTVAVLDAHPPVVMIAPASSEWTNSTLGYIITGTDSGGTVAMMKYIITKAANLSDLRPDEMLKIVFASSIKGKLSNGEGIWYIFANATDPAGIVCEYKRGGPYKIDKTAPNVSADPATAVFGRSGTVNITSSDELSGVKYIDTAWSALQTRPANFNRVFSSAVSETISQAGVYYLHVEVTDYAGNRKYVCYGPYEISGAGLSIDNVTIEGLWTYWNGSPDAAGKQTTDEPHRFMSLETVKINVFTSGFADKVVMRFSPELESMFFTDPNGNNYRYKEDFFGYEILFPDDGSCLTDGSSEMNHVYWEYALPLAPSTKEFTGNGRIGPSYRLTVTAFKGAEQVEYSIGDIELTGNVLDHIFIQPGSE